MRQRATKTTLMPVRARSFNCIVTDTFGGADVVPHSFGGVAADAPAPLGRWTLLAEFGRADLLPVRFEQDFIKEVGTLAQTRNESCLRVCRGGRQSQIWMQVRVWASVRSPLIKPGTIRRDLRALAQTRTDKPIGGR